MTNFKPMLAKDAELDKLTFPLIAQPKLDGIRCSIVNGKPLTRTLKDVPNVEIQAALSDSSLEGLDGEIIVGDPNAADAYRKTVSYVMAPNKTGEDWCFHVFDVWNSTLEFDQRRTVLEDRLIEIGVGTGTQPGLDYVVGVDSFDIETQDELDTYEASIVDNGGEGVILRDPAGLYKFGRSGKTGPLLKLKRFEDFEAEIVGVYEEMHNANPKTVNELGRGQRSSHQENKIGKGTLGGFVCRGVTDYTGIEFKVGTGFDAEMRSNYWNNPSIIGETVKVKAFPIGVKDKPRHPVFLGFRDLQLDG